MLFSFFIRAEHRLSTVRPRCRTRSEYHALFNLCIKICSILTCDPASSPTQDFVNPDTWDERQGHSPKNMDKDRRPTARRRLVHAQAKEW